MELSQKKQKNASHATLLRSQSMILKFQFWLRITWVYKFLEMLFVPGVELRIRSIYRWMASPSTSLPWISVPQPALQTELCGWPRSVLEDLSTKAFYPPGIREVLKWSTHQLRRATDVEAYRMSVNSKPTEATGLGILLAKIPCCLQERTPWTFINYIKWCTCFLISTFF